MAASTSHQPHNIPLPASPEPQTTQSKRRKKDRSKLQSGDTHTRRVGQSSVASKSTGKGESVKAWDWTTLTDVAASDVPPIFTRDGSYFFSLVGSSVKIYSVATGQVVSTLSAPRPTGIDASSDLVTSAILNPQNAFQLITGSLNGCIMVWDFLDAALLQTINVAQPIYFMCAHEEVKDSVFVATSPSRTSKRKSGSDDAVVLRVSLKPLGSSANSVVQKSSEVLAIGKLRFPTGLALSSSGSWLVATAGNKVYVAKTTSLASGFTKYVSPERLTCLVFHPTEEYFATGDVKGNIRLWYCLNENLAASARGVEKKTQTTTLHWHAHAVSSIAFTSNGAYLLSGGEESVLVIWQVHTGKKEFVPRVGAPIKTVGVSKVGSSEEEYLLGLADATYLFVSAGTLKISRSYSRIKGPIMPHNEPSTSTKKVFVPLAVHSLTSTLILPSSHPASLQIYSPSSSKLVSELEVSPSNRVSRKDERPIEPSRVEQTVISPSGEWMASIDSREGDNGLRGEVYLKIWRWDRKAGHWTLNTRIDRPHGLSRITGVVFSPVLKDHQMHLVTTGEDSCVKTWRLRTSKDKAGNSEEFWVTRSTFGFRSEKPNSASWSPDASLLAISLGPYVALYDPITNILRQTLTSPDCRRVTSAHFVGRGGRYLAAVGKKELLLWDLVTQSVRWHYRASSTIDSLVPHPQEDTFALFLRPSSTAPQGTQIVIFRPTACVPASIHSVPFGLRGVSWYSLNRTPSAFSLVGITGEWAVVLLGDRVHLAKEEGSAARGLAAHSAPQQRTLFQDIFGKSAFTTTPGDQSLQTQPITARLSTSRAVVGMFDGPAYLMPPLETLFDSLMGEFLKQRLDNAPISTEPIQEEDNDVDMDDETGPIIIGTQSTRVVNRAEIEALVSIFKKHTVKHKPTSPLNGKVNGAARSQINGIRPSTSPASKPSGAPARLKGPISQTATDIQSPSSTPTSPSTTFVNGKKRKKSLS